MLRGAVLWLPPWDLYKDSRTWSQREKNIKAAYQLRLQVLRPNPLNCGDSYRDKHRDNNKEKYKTDFPSIGDWKSNEQT